MHPSVVLSAKTIRKKSNKLSLDGFSFLRDFSSEKNLMKVPKMNHGAFSVIDIYRLKFPMKSRKKVHSPHQSNGPVTVEWNY